ncbi:NAD(P)-dependent oxidoreductase [Streptomyces clavuligerus]|uniref:Putative 3-hydroxyisobutyrate dehydrogenase n=1 Tax=Streptomyces clavuligerus TaxID=1901 RepID=B5GV69_STRCL|nr:NAD(P)-dependent oxidoreductase [Streptomyces clavuligerus]ANW20137.1 6-phosphogluconate dehydrogenase [Streptomyces clavuligerus]AXU14764.1 NAD(P)-dependent oxidoreductase [Streptomyces clavuligerus]EDY50215.1 6-phosphogluconate dehydrogenase [Streptomyces clavuligerus]EFG06953.1 Putative 3-hydroxyisobutyrate dehydrogenase [Streptomyces clavuligerus]MBY6304792.1 NAD(P)-dependent oxidoreductase [Streptomyces clavuligerus]
MTRVAVLGLGAMGRSVVTRLLLAGHEVLVWNRDRTACERLSAGPVVPVATPAEAARRAEAVILVVSDENAVRDVVSGPDGVAAGAAASPVTLIQMSTVAPATLHWLAGALPEGSPVLDAPVMAGPGKLAAGRGTVYVGGSEELVRQWTPLLRDIGEISHVGPVGAASAAKLVANSALFGIVALLGESVALAEGLGLDRDTAFEVLAATPLAAQAERRRASMEADEYPTRFSLRLAAKDARLIHEAAEEGGVELRIGAATRSWITGAQDSGYEEEDYTVILRAAAAGKQQTPERP